MSKRSLALLSGIFVALLYGLTFTYAKQVMNGFVKPYGFILLRIIGASLLFWAISFLGPKEKIDKQDYKYIIICAFFGLRLNMLTFFKGLDYTTPISASVIMITTPMLVLLLSALFLKQKIVLRKSIGISIGLIGTTILITYGKQSLGSGSNVALGNLLVFINAASYAAYMIIVKRLIEKYHAFTFIKWMYGVATIFILPFGLNELSQIHWSALPTDIIFKIIYVIVGATFITYLLNLFVIRELKPTTASVFIYLQPLFATIISLLLGSDQLTKEKLIAALLIFIGVYLVSKPEKTS